jgi:hypothetical protein
MQRKGLTDFNRTHRFVFSYYYSLPSLNRDGVLGGLLSDWSVGGLVTIQSGRALTLIGTNANNVYGITGDRAQLAPGCTAEELVTPGSVVSKLGNYFNRSCIGTYPIVGDDGRATAFGNSGVGIVRGPHQQNFDITIVKRAQMGWIRSGSTLDFRFEMFNALNTPQFADPDTNVSSATFGTISATAVAPRMVQLALKFNF